MLRHSSSFAYWTRSTFIECGGCEWSFPPAEEYRHTPVTDMRKRQSGSQSRFNELYQMDVVYVSMPVILLSKNSLITQLWKVQAADNRTFFAEMRVQLFFFFCVTHPHTNRRRKHSRRLTHGSYSAERALKVYFFVSSKCFCFCLFVLSFFYSFFPTPVLGRFSSAVRECCVARCMSRSYEKTAEQASRGLFEG